MMLAPLACFLYPMLVIQQRPDWESASAMPAVVRRALSEQPRWRYTGTRVVTYRRGPELLEHTEFVTRDGWQVRIEFPGESKYSGQIIVETESDRRHFDAKKNEIHITPPRREALFEHIRGSWRGEHRIQVTEESGDRVAGFSSRLVKVLDGSGNRIQELNIEPHSGVVLARRLYDEVGTQVGSFEFREINLHPSIDPSIFTLRRNGARVTTPVDDLRRVVANTNFVPMVLASSTGLQLDSARVRDIAGNPVLMSQYVSPLGRVILFQLSVGVDPKALDRRAPKNIHAVTEKIEGRWFVLVGPLDESKLRSALSTLRSGT